MSRMRENEVTDTGVLVSLPLPSFWDVKAILDWLALGRTMQQLKSVHGVTFGWSSRKELLESFVQLDPSECRPEVDCFQLVQPDMIGNGRGDQTNLVKAIRDSDGVAGWGQMPKNRNSDNQFATPLQIATIVAWIDAGCP